VTSWAGLPGFFLVVDELEKSSVVCPCSQTPGMASGGAIRTSSMSMEHSKA
jgi:hypothetical protein